LKFTRNIQQYAIETKSQISALGNDDDMKLHREFFLLFVKKLAMILQYL
jgi:hypothetical protein